MRFWTLLGAALFSVTIGVSAAQASATFDYSLVDNSSVNHGLGDFTLNLNAPALNVPNITVTGNLTAFTFTFDGNVFNLSNGAVTSLVFQNGALRNLTYQGSFIAANGDRLTLQIAGSRFSYTDQARFSSTNFMGNLVFDEPVPVPEPASWVLMLSALATFFAFALRPRQKHNPLISAA